MQSLSFVLPGGESCRRWSLCRHPAR